MPTTAYHSRNRQVREARRQKIMALRRAGVIDYSQLAQAVGTSVPTICRDMKIIEAEWRASAVTDMALEKSLDIQRAETAIRGLWPKATSGNPQAAMAMLAYLKFRAEVFGYEAPKVLKVDIESRVRAMAEQLGLDPEDAVIEAQAIIREGLPALP